MIAFHKALLVELRNRMQFTGMKIDDQVAQQIFLGADALPYAAEIAEELFSERFLLMKSWEEAHPGETPFPPLFAEVVLAKLRAMDEDNRQETIMELIKLAEAELTS